MGKWIGKNYFNLPWEHDADLRGGVHRNPTTPWADIVSDWYFRILKII